MFFTILPTLLLGNWTLVNITDITCPHYKDYTIHPEAINHKLSLYEVTDEDYNEYNNVLFGRDCSKLTLSTKCKAHLMASNEIEYEEIYESPDITDCNSLKMDNMIKYPESNCRWNLFDNGYISNNETTIKINDKSFLLDVHTGLIVNQDKIFNHCDEHMCEYKNNRGFWLRSKDINTEKELCTHLKNTTHLNKQEGYLSVYQNNKFLYIENNPVHYDDMCTIKRCNNLILTIKNFKKYVIKSSGLFQECKTDNIHYLNKEESFNEVEDHILCANKLVKVIKEKKLNYYDLKYFHPTRIGLHNIYRLNEDKKLEKNIAYYSKVDSDKDEVKVKSVACGTKVNCLYNGKHKINSEKEFNVDIKEYKIYKDEVEKGFIIEDSMYIPYEKTEIEFERNAITFDFDEIYKFGMGLLIIALILLILVCVVTKCKSRNNIKSRKSLKRFEEKASFLNI
ncbi:glycoprotein [Almendravirus balsa]|uniref:glycoprotein n=1 Tax=Almendravirus balsa TaxID=1972684 RepID=UPI001E281AFE|nr:glycoprotein [Almendravirus balsa]